MLNAHAIYRLLIDDEQPSVPPPDDPNQLGLPLDSDVDDLDPKSEVMRYAEQPFPVASGSPTTTYQTIQNRLGGKPQKKVDRNTYALRHPDRLAIRFHETDVVTAYPDGRVTVDSGGWKPGGGRSDPRFQGRGPNSGPGVTTMARMNDWLPSGWQIYKKDAEWYWFNTGQPRPWETDVKYPYTDGDTIIADGSLQLKAHPVYANPKRRRRMTA